MKWSKVMAVVAALVWGNSVFASLPTNPLASGGDTQVRIARLLEHFESRHPELNVRLRIPYAKHLSNDAVARQVLQDLSELDVVVEQNQPEPAQSSLRSLSCSRALCSKGDTGEDDSFPPLIRVSCPRAACFGD